MERQNALTLVCPVLISRQIQLFSFLKGLKESLKEGMHESFENIGTIHFARWLVIDYDTAHNTAALHAKPKLVFTSNFDGPVKQQIRDLCTEAGDILDSIYDCCEGYPSAAERNPTTRMAYLRQWMVKPSAFYIGSPGRSLPQIKNEYKLRNFVRAFLDTRSWEGIRAQEVHQAIRQAVAQEPEFSWTHQRISLPKMNIPGMILLGLVLLILLPVVIVWVLIIQFRYERHDKYFNLKRSQLNEYKMKRLEEYEDIEMQNQFSQLVEMKPGKMRLITFKAMMLFAKALIRFQFVKGKLMGIPTIHFARWVLFDENKRVLFFSNFDGSWQQYLGDFIDKSGWGLTGIFSNTTEFPKTKFLITGGAYDEEHFLAWSRNSEIQTQIWYNAYPQLSIKNINNNTRIRYDLSRYLSERSARKFLSLI